MESLFCVRKSYFTLTNPNIQVSPITTISFSTETIRIKTQFTTLFLIIIEETNAFYFNSDLNRIAQI